MTMYRPVPTNDGPLYPPSTLDTLETTYRPTRQSRSRIWTIGKLVLVSVIGTVVLHYFLLGAFPSSAYTRHFRPPSLSDDESEYDAAVASTHEIFQHFDPAAGQPGTFFRDTRPIRSMLAFWELAQQEVQARRLDTCEGRLGRELIDAYHRSQMGYCLPNGREDETPQSAAAADSSSTKIWCAPIHRDDFSKWWPYPQAPCFSTHIRTIPDNERKFRAAGCAITQDGHALADEMDKERFLGSDLQDVSAEPSTCQAVTNRTMLVVGRQDQWNPFHVAEDLITTLVAVFVAVRMVPSLIDTRVQIVFVEGFGMDGNHFTPLWDRIGAWAPRRLSLDPWSEVTNTIHSVGAGASLLSAPGIGRPYQCASTITWAAAHYYRHLFGLLPGSLTREKTGRQPINVLWLSRAKLDSYAQKHNDWSQWRGVRHITNEPELIKRLKSGMKDLCEDPESGLGCSFEDAQDIPESWALTSPVDEWQPIPLRFASIDPTVHALETQIHYVGHTTVLVSSHGGALGLSLFLPPGHASILELQVESVYGNFHFQHMAAEMGHEYEKVDINTEVDVDHVWSAVRQWIMRASSDT